MVHLQVINDACSYLTGELYFIRKHNWGLTGCDYTGARLALVWNQLKHSLQKLIFRNIRVWEDYMAAAHNSWPGSWKSFINEFLLPSSKFARRKRLQYFCFPNVNIQIPCPTDATKVLTEKKLIFGVQRNSTFLECSPRSQQTLVVWSVQRSFDSQQEEVISLNAVFQSLKIIQWKTN